VHNHPLGMMKVALSVILIAHLSINVSCITSVTGIIYFYFITRGATSPLQIHVLQPGNRI